MGQGSPAWDIIGQPSTKMFDIYMTNFNSWTFAEPDYVVHTQNSVMNLGAFSNEYTQQMLVTTFAPVQLGSYLFRLESFGFGKTDEAANTQYYETLMNTYPDEPDSFFANTTSLNLNFRGLGLPSKNFNRFSNLLSVISKGESTCLSRKAGYCALSNPCSHYRDTGLWDYDFKVKFGGSEDENYLRVPLATFAADYAPENACVIFVEYLDDSHNDSKFVIFGGMFFQSFYAQYTLFTQSTAVSLYKNLNALQSTYLGSKIYNEGPNPFVVPVANLQNFIDAGTEMNGLPTFLATVEGITDNLPYFHLDFMASHTMVFDINCMTTGLGAYPANPCTSEPVNAYNGFDGSPAPMQQVGTFSNARFGGYLVSGTQYTSKLCFGTYNCKFVTVYGVDQVAADNWLWNSDGTYGTIGVGPTSFIWTGFIDPDTKLASYSIELARLQVYTND